MSFKKNSLSPFLLLLGAATILMVLASLCLGRYSISIPELLEIISSKIMEKESQSPLVAQNVVWMVRLPRVIAALLVGGSLAVSGATYQSIFKNPLASPDLLGVFQGSCVGAAIAILLSLGNLSIQFCALGGGIAAVSLTNLITRTFKNNSTSILVLSGVIVSGLMSSILGLLKYWMDSDTQLPTITYWQMGSLSDMTIEKVWMVAPTMMVCIIVLLSMRWQFNLLSLGDNEARSIGVNFVVIRGLTVVCSTLLTSCAVCLSGTISWVGLIIPHLARIFVGPNNTKLVPISVLMGAIFLLVIDTIGRTISSVEIPLSILTGIIGAPGFILLISRQRMSVQ